jgi:hypothetical protein
MEQYIMKNKWNKRFLGADDDGNFLVPVHLVTHRPRRMTIL